MTKIAILVTMDFDESKTSAVKLVYGVNEALNKSPLFTETTSNGSISVVSHCCRADIVSGACENCGNAQHLLT